MRSENFFHLCQNSPLANVNKLRKVWERCIFLEKSQYHASTGAQAGGGTRDATELRFTLVLYSKDLVSHARAGTTIHHLPGVRLGSIIPNSNPVAIPQCAEQKAIALPPYLQGSYELLAKTQVFFSSAFSSSAVRGMDWFSGYRCSVVVKSTSIFSCHFNCADFPRGSSWVLFSHFSYFSLSVLRLGHSHARFFASNALACITLSQKIQEACGPRGSHGWKRSRTESRALRRVKAPVDQKATGKRS